MPPEPLTYEFQDELRQLWHRYGSERTADETPIPALRKASDCSRRVVPFNRDPVAWGGRGRSKVRGVARARLGGGDSRSAVSRPIAQRGREAEWLARRYGEVLR